MANSPDTVYLVYNRNGEVVFPMFWDFTDADIEANRIGGYVANHNPLNLLDAEERRVKVLGIKGPDPVVWPERHAPTKAPQSIKVGVSGHEKLKKLSEADEGIDTRAEVDDNFAKIEARLTDIEVTLQRLGLGLSTYADQARASLENLEEE